MNSTHRNSWMKFAKSDYSKKIEKVDNISRLIGCKACESMRVGYEQMANINLDMCDWGCTDFQNAIVIFENVLNGDDTERDY